MKPSHSRPTDIDKHIDQTLSSLGAVQPSSNLQHRLLAALEERRAETKPSRFKALHLLLGTHSAVVGLALALCVGLAILYAYRTPPHSSETPILQRSANLRIITPARNPTNSTLPNSSLTTERKPFTPTFQLSITNSPSPAAGVAQLISAQTALDRAALEDFNAPSTLAPPMPPTAQERLVRLMLRSGEKQNLAQLDPVQQAAFSRAEQSAVREFFDPPPSPELREAMAKQAEQVIQPQSSAETQTSMPAAQMPDPTVSPKPSGDPQ